MMRTVNDIYHVEISRGMVKDVLISFGITAGFLVSVVCSFVLVVAGRTIIRVVPKYLPVPPAMMDGLHDASFWVMIAFIFVFLMLFNKVVPNLHLRFREVWPGALFSLVAWILVSLGFSFYVDNMARYSVLYGSLAAIIVLMLWLYIVSMIDLGAQPRDFDCIVTGDLGHIGADLLLTLLRGDSIDLSPVYSDCGSLIFGDEQDAHAGGSGCGCSAAVLCGPLLRDMHRGKIHRLVFAGTGAMMSPTSVQQGQPIAGICHAVVLERSEA